MIAVDTNVLVRYLVEDDLPQYGRAVQRLEEGDAFIPKTVLLETEWVLRSRYRYSWAEIGAGLRGVIGLPTVTVEDTRAIASAMDWADAGMDFADAVHLASSTDAAAFASFDRTMRRQGEDLGCSPKVIEP